MMLPGLFLASVLLAALSGLPGPLAKQSRGRFALTLLSLSAVCGWVVAGAALFAGKNWSLDLPWSLINARFALHFDALGALFLVPCVGIPPVLARYGNVYWTGDRAPRLRFFFGLSVAAMALLTAAAQTVLFLFAWEIMAFMGFLMVAIEDREADVREASWIFFVAAHAGVLFLFAGFAVLASATGSFLLGPLPPGWCSTPAGTAAFLLLLIGFGLKAGLFPFHVWLPVAHASAPSHISALLSGLMLKMGVLGLVRLIAWTPDPPLWWAGALVGLGAASGILGLVLSLGQQDLKRMLAYSSIENIGLITLGLGLALAGKALHNAPMLVLGGAGALLHVLNHAIIKPLLFMGAGSVVHATNTRDMEQLGGLAKRMPRISNLFLLGAAALCGLPPLNGFVGEWLMYVGAFRSLAEGVWVWAIIVIVALALVGALAVATFTRTYGITFLGEARSELARAAHESPKAMGGSMRLLAIVCLFIGLFPIALFPALNRAAQALAPDIALPSLRACVSLGVLSLVGLAGLLVTWVIWTRLRRTESTQAPTWDCGYVAPTSRIQYTATSFSEMLNGIFRSALWPAVHWPRIQGLFPRPSHFESRQPDPVLDRGMKPGFRMLAWASGWLRVLQSGHLPVYLLYVVLTLVILLAWTLT